MKSPSSPPLARHAQTRFLAIWRIWVPMLKLTCFAVDAAVQVLHKKKSLFKSMPSCFLSSAKDDETPFMHGKYVQFTVMMFGILQPLSLSGSISNC